MSSPRFPRSTFLLLFGLALLAALPARAVDGPGVVNINTATKAELQFLPGVGAKRADLILQVREKRKFDTIEQIRRVKGVGRGTFRKLKPYLAVNGPTTLTAKVKRVPTAKDDHKADKSSPTAPSNPGDPEAPEQG